MTAFTSTRHNLKPALVIAAVAAMALVGTVWAQGSGQQAAMAMDSARIDVWTLVSSDDIAKLPVHNIIDAI